MIDAIGSAASGLRAAELWMASTANNLANEVTPAFRAQEPTFAAAPGLGGVTVTGLATTTAPNLTYYDPTNPIANKQGIVTLSNVDPVSEITNTVIAQDSVEANVAVIREAEAAYKAVIALASKNQ
jgi:flagellar basal-body rod protein FlgC